jgi:hypothetical protein
MPFEIRTVFPAAAHRAVCVLVDGSRRDVAVVSDTIASTPPRSPSIAGDAAAALRGPSAVAEARRLRTRIRRAGTNNEP